MSTWRFQLRSRSEEPVDGSVIQHQQLQAMSPKDVERIPILVDGRTLALADVFQVTHQASHVDQIVVAGELTSVHGLGTGHDSGEFVIDGDAGDHVGSRMSGGTLHVAGSVGNHLAAPAGGHRLGMTGGRLVVDGDAGHFAGHRMRRGTVWINGNVGDHLGGAMIAGTIIVAGDFGAGSGLAMQRGTLIVAKPDERSWPQPRFSRPVRFNASFLKLLRPFVPASHRSDKLIDQLVVDCTRVRGDRCVGGQGEILMPG
ncbi:GltB/FmdC/FwdC-like GXGXG domain-containing protein [Stieleria varia]|uniref:Formyltransferase/hydrolase complex Fhc subunit C n=1 Tax=Stieleria varia TaxID=2528005 RepID=A0A5C6BDK1_9BACT|nr:formylmethanofuran dehydrogenase subunit C [Stieleria varia]TWU08524.1 Formyltransferase/hydrolase complex Fhc subunit C [Stieleria varia]